MRYSIVSIASLTWGLSSFSFKLSVNSTIVPSTSSFNSSTPSATFSTVESTFSLSSFLACFAASFAFSTWFATCKLYIEGYDTTRKDDIFLPQIMSICQRLLERLPPCNRGSKVTKHLYFVKRHPSQIGILLPVNKFLEMLDNNVLMKTNYWFG